MKKLLLLGSVVTPCPPKKQGGTERVAYVQAKQLAKLGVNLILVGAHGTEKNFKEQLTLDGESDTKQLLEKIEFVEIGGGTAFGSQADSRKYDRSLVEASRNLRLEMVNLAKVQELMVLRKDEYDVILNNMRGETVFLAIAKMLGKKVFSVMHLNIFEEMADIFKKYDTKIITIADHQRNSFPDLNYATTINNPVNTSIFSFNNAPKNYALFSSTIGEHKNQKDAILACKKASIPLVICGKIRDQDYFDNEIKPHIDDVNVIYKGEVSIEESPKLYQDAKVFLFPIKIQEAFGLVAIEALSCGTPVIAYPHGGPAEIIEDGKNGFLVNTADEMAEKIKIIDSISRQTCRKMVEERYSEKVIGQKYFNTIAAV